MTDHIPAILSACAGPIAFFSDFDGTLVEIAPRPESVEVPTELMRDLVTLERALDGALAIVTGRTLLDIDAFLHAHPFSISASHGTQQRHNGSAEAPDARSGEIAASVARTVRSLLGADDRILIEPKPTGVAVHYRAAPERGNDVRRAMSRALAEYDLFHALEGKMVVEARPRGTNKGKAIERLMTLEPFSGRIPFFVGDDVTDEDGFAAVLAMGGIAVKVGGGETCARFRLNGVSDVRNLIAALARLQHGQTTIPVHRRQIDQGAPK